MIDDRDISDMRDALTELMPDLATVTRVATTQTGGDYEPGATTTVATDTPARVMPLGLPTDDLPSWPTSVRNVADHIVTMQHSVAVETGDSILVTGRGTFEVVALRLDDSSFPTCVRCATRRIE